MQHHAYTTLLVVRIGMTTACAREKRMEKEYMRKD
jgi:hypothetical protein